MTSYDEVYTAFLSKIREDDWCNESDIEVIKLDMRTILDSALLLFKFPKVNLENRNDEGFKSTLDNDEIQLLANLMKEEWLSRTIHSWENVKMMYDERDFSQANLLNNFIKLLEFTQNRNRKLLKTYARTRKDDAGKKVPFDYTTLAGG